jgi:hypothetical protein
MQAPLNCQPISVSHLTPLCSPNWIARIASHLHASLQRNQTKRPLNDLLVVRCGRSLMEGAGDLSLLMPVSPKKSVTGIYWVLSWLNLYGEIKDTFESDFDLSLWLLLPLTYQLLENEHYFFHREMICTCTTKLERWWILSKSLQKACLNLKASIFLFTLLPQRWHYPTWLH